MTHHSAYRIVASAGSWAYAAALNVVDRWAAGLVAYRG